MCAFEILNIPQDLSGSAMSHFEIHICEPSDSGPYSSPKSSTETVHQLPAYTSTTTLVHSPSSSSSRSKGLFSRLFSRSSKKTSSSTSSSGLPSYREAELALAWAAVGIDINDRKQGPRPHCTPDEWLGAMDGLFGAPSRSKTAAPVVRADLSSHRI